MNWWRGLMRLWVVLSGVWIALVAAIVAGSESVNSMMVVFWVAVLPSAALLLLLLLGKWVLAGLKGR